MHIVDSLILELGIDLSRFEQQAKKAEQAQKKLEESGKKAEKAAQSSEKQHKKTAEQMDKLGKTASGLVRILGHLGIALGALGLLRLASDAAAANQQMENLSRNLGMSRKELQAWQGAATMAGGSAQGLTGYMQQLSGSMTRLVMMGDTSMLPYFNALGVSMLDSSGKARKLDDVMLDLADRFSKMDRTQAYNMGKMMGMDDGTVNVLMRGRSELERMAKAQEKLYRSSDKDVQNSIIFNEKKAYLAQQWASLLQMIGDKLIPVLTKAVELASGLMQVLIDNGPMVTAVFYGLSAIIGGKFLLSLVSGAGWLGSIVKILTGGLIPALGGVGAAIWATVAPLLPAIAIITALAGAFYLLYDDYKVWARGGHSALDWGWLENFKDGRLWIERFTKGLSIMRDEIRNRLQPVLEKFAKLWSLIAQGDMKGAWEVVKEGSRELGKAVQAGAEKAVEAGAQAAQAVAETKVGQAAVAAYQSAVPIYIGDSIAHGYRKSIGAKGTTQVGASPKKVLDFVNRQGSLKGQTVMLSSGLSNNPGDTQSIEQQIAALKAKGANVVLFGVANDFKGSTKTGAAMNAKLQAIAAVQGVQFLGGFKSGSDHVHPRSYTGGGLPQAIAAQAMVSGRAIGAKAETFLDFIGKGEGKYTSVNRGAKFGYGAKNIANLTKMTVAEVYRRQRNMEFNAAGKFQIVRDTMPSIIKGMGLTGNELFDEAMQERMGVWLAFHKRPQLGAYIKGKHSDRTKAGNEAAREWASLPVLSASLATKVGKKIYHSRRGATAYSDGVNRASHKPEEVERQLDKARELYAHAVRQGMSEREAEWYAMHGTGKSAFNRPIAGQAVAGNLQANRSQIQAATSAPQQVSHHRSTQVVVNGGVHVQSSAATISGTAGDAVSGINDRLVQFDHGVI